MPILMTKILPLPIADIPEGFGLHVCCEDRVCHKGWDYWPDELLEILGPKATFHDALNDLTCPWCGRRPVGIRQFYRLGVP